MRPFFALLYLSSLLALGSVAVARDVPRGVPLDTVQGSVREESGRAIPGARVELRFANRVLIVGLTDGEGNFRLLTQESWEEGWSLRVERLGYLPTERSVPPGLEPVEILLPAAPLPLPGFDIEGERDFCAGREDSVARRLWEQASLLHAGGIDTLGIATYTLVRVDTLQIPNVLASTGIMGTEEGQRGSAPLLRLSWNRRIEAEGYAFPVRRTEVGRSYDSWSYPPLEADFAPHFGSRLFGAQHDFHIVETSDAGATLYFCGRRTGRPHLEGTMTIGADTLIQRVDWRFRTREPEEGAGGWARFAPGSAQATTNPLLPTESVVWRSLPDGSVLRRAQWYDGWILAQGDSVPFLPER